MDSTVELFSKMFELYRDDSELAPKLGLEFSLCNPLKVLEDVRPDF